jgi:predicted amidohydrolase YtcJ
VSAHLILHGARFHTLDGQPPAEAMAVRDGRIAAIGRRADVEGVFGTGTRRVDLGGGTVVPGFDDAHVHVWKIGQLQTALIDLRGTTSLDALYAAVTRRAAGIPRGGWILGRGWNEAALGGSTPTRAGLDRAAPDHPVVLTRTCAHIHVASSAALQRAGVDAATAAPAGGAVDLERGLLYETAYGLVQRALPVPTRSEIEDWIIAGAKHLASLGVTAACDAAVDPATYAAYRGLESARRLPIRISLLHLLRPDVGDGLFELPPPHASDWLRCDTAKLFADGGLSGATAAVSEPYRNGTGDRGILRLEAGEIEELSGRAGRAGYRVATHAIGDRAIEATLEAYERLGARGAARPRPRIEHFGLPTAAHFERARRLGVHVVTQPIFLRELAASFERVLPAALAARVYPFRAMHDAGLPTAYSSDGPVVQELSPLAGIAIAAGAGVPVEAALVAYTQGAAAAGGAEADRGTLSVGRRADAVVLDGDPFTVPPAELTRLRVRSTLIDGRLAGEHA